MSDNPHSSDELRALDHAGKYADLTSACRDNVAHLKKKHGDSHRLVRAGIKQLARALYRSCDFESAEGELLHGIETGSTNDKEAIEMTIVLLLDLAQVYLAAKRDADVDVVISRAEALLDQIGGGRPLVAAVLCGHRARSCMRRGQLTDAERFLIKSKALVLREYGANNPYYAVTLDILSDLFDQEGRVPLAERMIRKALHAYETTLHRESLEYAIALSKLGLLEAKQGKLTDAHISQKTSLDILKRVCPPEHPRIHTVRARLEELERQLKKSEEEVSATNGT